MFLRPVLLGTTLVLSLAACSHNSSPRKTNATSVKTSFVVMAGEQENTSTVIQANDRFLERSIRPAAAAVLSNDFTYTSLSGERTKLIPEGTQLFGAYGSAYRIDYGPSASSYDAQTTPPLTLGESGKNEKASEQTSSSPLLAKLRNRKVARLSGGFAVYCGLMSAKYDSKDMWGAVFTLGLNLTTKNKDVFCLQDTDLDGNFDRVWDSSLDYAFPPTVNSIYNDRATTPVGYETIAAADIEPIGTLWLQLSRKGFRKGELEVNSRLGRDGKFVEFDNQRKKISIGEDGKTEVQPFFGASYVVEATHSNEHKRVHITPAKADASISLSKRVYYTNRTTYIPIFVPR